MKIFNKHELGLSYRFSDVVKEANKLEVNILGNKEIYQKFVNLYKKDFTVTLDQMVNEVKGWTKQSEKLVETGTTALAKEAKSTGRSYEQIMEGISKRDSDFLKLIRDEKLPSAQVKAASFLGKLGKLLGPAGVLIIGFTIAMKMDALENKINGIKGRGGSDEDVKKVLDEFKSEVTSTIKDLAPVSLKDEDEKILRNTPVYDFVSFVSDMTFDQK